MKKGELFEATIDHIEFPNKGICYKDERKIFIKDTLPGQKVKAMLIKKRKKKCEGKIVEILEEANGQIEASCSHFSLCGGCTYQNYSYDKQLELKRNQVEGFLHKGHIDSYEFDEVIESPNKFEYRNKMEFSFGDEFLGGPLTLGLHMKGKMYEILTTDKCEIVDEDFRKVLSKTLEFVKEKNYSFYHKRRHEGILRHLVVRKSIKKGDILVNLVTSSQQDLTEDMKEYRDMLLKEDFLGHIGGILHTINDNLADTVKSDKEILLYGKNYIVEELLGLNFEISPYSFFQTNTLGAEKLYEKINDYVLEGNDSLGISEKPVVFDLFSGTGTIGQVVSKSAKEVYGIELVEEAVEKANFNTKLNSIDNCKFIAGDVFEKVDILSKEGHKPEVIILDPPRPGVGEKALSKIVEFGAKKIVYISCKASSLTEDLKFLKEHNYIAKKVAMVDMFSHTPHIETVVMLIKEDL